MRLFPTHLKEESAHVKQTTAVSRFGKHSGQQRGVLIEIVKGFQKFPTPSILCLMQDVVTKLLGADAKHKTGMKFYSLIISFVSNWQILDGILKKRTLFKSIISILEYIHLYLEFASVRVEKIQGLDSF